MNDGLELATLGGGCFWCIEAVFQGLNGVKKVESGYAGGEARNPTYEQVCSGATGHAEVVQITFDPCLIAYEELLDVFFHVHDPTTPNRQGQDVGTQYRSVIFFHNGAQENTARQKIAELTKSGLWQNVLVTEVRPFSEFYRAEAYHQNYYSQHQAEPYCALTIAPKLNKLSKRFKDKLTR